MWIFTALLPLKNAGWFMSANLTLDKMLLLQISPLMFRGGYYYILNSFALGETDRLGPGKNSYARIDENTSLKKVTLLLISPLVMSLTSWNGVKAKALSMITWMQQQ